jgi:hypothetical protein
VLYTHRLVRVATATLFTFGALATFVAPLAGCLNPGGNAASHLAAAPAYDAPGQAKCSVKKSAEHPLVVEWPSADRATLEAKAQSGLVAVRYVGCEMEVLHRCKLPGRYGYTSITPKHDTVTIRDTDELYASMPVGAAKLEGTLAQTGQLNVSMTIVGRYDADHTDFPSDVLESDDCARATHVVSGMTTGAFELSTGADASVGGGVSVAGVGAGGKSTAKRETLERDGHEEKCEGGGGAAGQPPDGCGAVLRLDVVPLVTPKHEKREVVVGNTEEASPDAIAPNLYPEGNLRVAVYCAESIEIRTPETGLRVLIDGKTDGEKSLKTNFMTTLGTQTVNKVQVPVTLMNYTDVGFLVHPGLHHLRIETDDCAPLDADVTISGTHAVNVEANMEVSKDVLKGPVGAPWGGAWLFGASYGTMPSALFQPHEGTHYAGYGTPSTIGGLLGFTYEHRYFAAMFNYFIGYGSYSGTATQEMPTTGSAPTTAFSGSQFDMMVELRLGARLPLHYVTLMAGSGIGASMWIASATASTSATATTDFGGTLPDSLSGFWHIPLWGAVDIKRFCNWGIEIGGALNVQPTAFDGSYTLFHAGFIYQPSPSCERVAGINVSP